MNAVNIIDNEERRIENIACTFCLNETFRNCHVCISWDNIRNNLHDQLSYRDWETDRKSTRLNSSHITRSRMPSSA